MHLKTLLNNVNSWADFKSKVSSLSKKEKGNAFEELTKYYLLLNPVYRNQLKSVWLQKEIPAAVIKKLNLPSNDQGIDLIAENCDGSYWAIQCKFIQDEAQRLSHRVISTFTSLSKITAKQISYCLVANESLKNVGGMEILKDWLEKRKQAFDFKAQTWGLSEPKGLLLLGVPGCGKSLTAKCIASLWNMPLLRLDIGKVFEGTVGSSESNIRRAIATAEAVAPCVLWIDEIEKGLSGVQSSGSTDGGTTSRIFSTILTWMQEKVQPVFVVATANDISMLPPELLRKGRFDEIFFVDLPSEVDRKSIFSIHLANALNDTSQKSEDFGLDKLAKESKGFNGAEIEECVKEAKFTAYTENRDEPKLQIIHLLNAIKETVPLSKTMKDQIEFLRKWAKSRAKQAGSTNNEDLQGTDVVPLTKVEKELNRSFD